MSAHDEKLYHWDLSNVYPSLESEEFTNAMLSLADLIEDLSIYMEQQDISADGLIPKDGGQLVGAVDGILDRINELQKLYRTLSAYLYSFTTTDSFNTLAQRLLSELQIQGTKMHQLEVRFQGWIGQLAPTPGSLDDLTKGPGSAGDHGFFLRETVEQSQFLLSEVEEALASELSLSGSSGWEKLQGVIASQLKANYDDDGTIQALPITVVQTYRNHADSSIRRRAFEAELAAWESVREPLAACMNGVKGEVNTLNKRRGREDVIASSLEKARIDRETLDAMLSAMRSSFPAFRRYYQAKARILGLEKLPWWDLFAPVGQSDHHFTYDEANAFILEQFGTFSERLVQLSKQAFDNAWIDAEPREGKVGGAFCMSVPAVEESRILCNFDGTLDQVATLAHELGHAYHNFCLEGKTQLQRRVPMTLAETASIFNQTIITDALLSNSPAAEEKLGILESFLMDSGQVIVDIYSRYLFEKEVFTRREEAELSADDLCELMLDCQRETFGEGLDGRHLNPYMWAWKPHYYHADLSFYNYPYAFGLLFGLGLYKIYKQGDRGFQKQYDQLLRDSGEFPAAELASRFGINLREPKFWEDSLDVIRDRIATYEELSYQIK